MEHFGIKNLDELPNASELRYIPLPNGATTPTNEPDPPQLFGENSQAKETDPDPPSPPETVTSETTTELAIEPGAPIEGPKNEE